MFVTLNFGPMEGLSAEELQQLQDLAAAGIEMNCQLVVCRGVNDGAELRRTLDDLLPLAEHKLMEKTFTVFDRNDMFDADGIPQDRWTFIGMTKFYDHTRPGNMSELSDRSYPVIRLGELYLIRAEARIRSTTNQDLKGAAEDITELRKRAVNHEKPEYEEAMKVTEEDMTLDFILEERARELFGEWQRRLDLKRFGRLIDQVRIYNPDAKDNIKEYHVVRPIPQTQFDGMPDWTTLGQNEGY